MTFFLALLGLFLGSLNGASLLSSLFHLENPKSYGSKNPGATNVTRKYGLKIGMIVFLFDFAKIALFLYVLKSFLLVNDHDLGFYFLIGVLGHCYSPFLNFKGGKGVSSFFGGLFIINSKIAVLSLICWAVTYLFYRVSAVSAVSAVFFILGVFHDQIISNISICLVCILILSKHCSNFRSSNYYSA